MNEEKTIQPGATTSMPVEAAPGEKHSAVIVRGISMPPHQVRMAIDQAVAREQLSEEDGEEAIWWLYNYAQANCLNESALAARMKAYDKNTLYQVFRGSYGVNNKDGRHASWSNVVKAIKAFKAVAIEEAKKKNIGLLDTEVKRTVWQCCDAALNDGMVSFIYGPTRCGKTFSLKAYQRSHNHGTTVYIELGSGWNRQRFVRELAAILGNGVKAAKTWVLEDAIFKTFKRSNLLIVDEFHKALSTLGRDASRALLEFIRDIRDKTECGLVLCATKEGLEDFETGANAKTFRQMIGRAIVKAVLPDRPALRDFNTIARAFELPLPTGEDLQRVKGLVAEYGMERLFVYLQKTHALTRQAREPMSWAAFAKVMNGYLSLAHMKNGY